MAWTHETSWKPTRLLEVGRTLDTSTGPARVMTDAGPAYLKAMGNRQGPHVLATDWVGTLLAKWLGLSTFEIAILPLEQEDVFDLPRGAKAKPGPGFVAKALDGDPWGKSGLQLDALVNPEDVTRLVVFDTWTRNCDLSSEGVEPGRRRLIAMDHGLCFIRSGEELTPRLGHIDKVQDENVYGLFPEFRDKLREDTITDCVKRLREMDAATAEAMIETVPREWEVSTDARKAWGELIYRRAIFVADNVGGCIEKVAPWFKAQGA